MIRTTCEHLAAYAVAAIFLLLPAMTLRAQDTSYDCVMEAKSTIELQSAEEGILERVLVERGDRVKAGEIVARLDSEQEVLAAETARLRADFRRKEAERLQDLRDTDAIPEREYVSALTEYEIAKLEHAQAESLLKRRSIRSPVDGVVVDITMFRGEYVHKQATMMTIAEIDPLYIEVFMPVSEYESVQPGMPAIVSPEFPIGGNFDAQVAVVDSVFDAASRTFRIRLILQNDDYALPAGLRCTVRFLRADGRP